MVKEVGSIERKLGVEEDLDSVRRRAWRFDIVVGRSTIEWVREGEVFTADWVELSREGCGFGEE